MKAKTLELVREREEARLIRLVEVATTELEQFRENPDVGHLLRSELSKAELAERGERLLKASPWNAPIGFVPLLRVDLWPILNMTVRIKAKPNKDAKAEVLARDRICRWCRVSRSTTVDHILPIARGGSNHRSNLVGSCRTCNELKAEFLPAELGWKLIYKPFD